jgi:hypothetical protein
MQLLSEMSSRKWGLACATVGDVPFDADRSDGADGGSAVDGGAQPPHPLWQACWRDRSPACAPHVPEPEQENESTE